MSVVDDTPEDSPFFWGWTDAVSRTSLAECQTLGMNIIPQSGSTNLGVPPYYVMAWKENGVPTVSPVGSDSSNLSWQVNQESGSSLLVTVVDSRGSDGGLVSFMYSVTDSTTTSDCLPPPPSENIKIAANVSTSETLQACEPLEVQISGGQKPYTVTIAVLNSAMVANITLHGDDDILTWPNQAGPNKQFIVSVSDANGVWGTSTGIYNTAGESTGDCPIRTTSRSSASTGSNPQQSPQASQSPTGIRQDNAHHSGSGFAAQPWHFAAIVAPVVIVGILLGLVFFLRRRRQQRGRARGERRPSIISDTWTRPNSSPGQDPNTDWDAYRRVLSSGEIILEPKPVIQHEDSADAQDLPPPYKDRLQLAGSSTDPQTKSQ